MGMRNAFEDLATEGMLRQVLRLLSLARDSSDRLRVVIDNGPQAVVYTNNTSTSLMAAATSPSPFSTGSWNAMDAREPMRDQSLMAFQAARNRWTIT